MKTSKIPKYLLVTVGTLLPTDCSLEENISSWSPDIIWYPSHFIIKIDQKATLESMKKNPYGAFLLKFPTEWEHCDDGNVIPHGGNISDYADYGFAWENQDGRGINLDYCMDGRAFEIGAILNTFFLKVKTTKNTVIIYDAEKDSNGNYRWRVDAAINGRGAASLTVNPDEVEKFYKGKKFKFVYEIYEGKMFGAIQSCHAGFINPDRDTVKYATLVEPIFI